MPTQKINSPEQEVDSNSFISMATYIDLNPMTASGKLPYAATIRASLTFIEWATAIFSLSAHDSSNYYTLDLRLRQPTGDVTIASMDTKTLGAGIAGSKVITVTTFTPTTVTGTGYLYVQVTKTASPADLYIVSPIIRVRYS